VNSGVRKLQFLLLVAMLSVTCCFAQKVKVGYDKTADFSKYKSYTLQKPATTPNRPLLYASITGTIKNDLEAKGIASREKDGDLTLIATGGFDYGLNSDVGLSGCQNCPAPLVDAMDWTGKIPAGGASGTAPPKGTLQLTFVDRANNKVVWTGTVTQKLDATKQDQALQRVGAAVDKLMAEFPPKK